MDESHEVDTAGPESVDPSGSPQDDRDPVQAVKGVRLTGRRVGGPARKPCGGPSPRVPAIEPSQRIVLLDVWTRSGLVAAEFGALVGLTAATLYEWKKRFDRDGPAGLMDRPRGARQGSRLPEATQRAILLMKTQHPEWGTERIRDVLMRAEGYGASPGAIQHVLREAGYQVEEPASAPHPALETRFERARPNQLWQTDLFTFLLKRENRRVYMVVYLDDHSRFVVGYGVWASAGGMLVREVLEAAIANFGAPEEVLTDNGPQYVTWRGKSAFARLLERRGIRHLVARPRRPQTLGKCERFWGTLWRECVEAAVFSTLEEARKRVGLFIDHYNFQRPHQGIEGLVPADRYFQAAPDVLKTLRERVAANALELAQHGAPRKSFYLTGRVGEAGISLHSEGSRVVLMRPDGAREEVDLDAPGRRAQDGQEADLPAPLAVSAEEHPESESESEEYEITATDESMDSRP
jgi:transposase InsO family protein